MSALGSPDIGVDARAFKSSIGMDDFLRSREDITLPIEDRADLVITIHHTGLPLIERPAFVLLPSDPGLLKYSRLIFQLPRKNLAVVTFEKVAKGDSASDVQDWVDSLASIGFGRIVVQHEGNFGRYAVGDFVQPRPVPGLPFFDRRFQLREDRSRQCGVTLVYGNMDSDDGLSFAWPPRAVDLIFDDVEPPDELPLFPIPIRIESILADPPPSHKLFLMQEKADLVVMLEIEPGSSHMRVERPVLPGRPVDAASLARLVRTAAMPRKELAVIAYAGKITEEIPAAELDAWIDTLRSAGFRQIIIQRYGNYAGDGTPLRQWPVPSSEVVLPRPAPSPFTFERPIME